MEKYTYIIGYIAALAAALATVFKIQHFPYTGTIIVIALTLLCIYLPFFIIDKTSDSAEGKASPAYIVAALCSAIIPLGVLFKLEHWPGASALLTIGLAGISLIFVPMLFIQKSKQAGANNLMNGAGALGIALFGLGLLTKIQHWPGPQVLLPVGAALVLLIYFPMYMMNKTIPEEKKVNHLRDAFFVVIIGCILLLFAGGMIGWKLIPPSTTPVSTEQSK
jgi:hypothetical protein